MRRKLFAAGLVLAAVAGSVVSARAETLVAARGTQEIAAASCRIESLRDLDFGTDRRRFAAPLDAEGALGLACSRATPFALGLSGGRPGASGGALRMPGPGWRWFVAYGLYKDAARSEPWGDSGAALLAGTADARVLVVAVHGRVPAQPAPPDGAYGDLVTVTVSY
jgi:spore coat protein U-like protein